MTLRSYALKFTDASAAAESIRKFVPQKATVEPDARTNSIIVHGDDAAHDLVERMIEFYDVE